MLWIPFFSQTGSELANIIEATGVEPTFILTNKNDLSDIDKRLESHIIVQFNKWSELDRLKTELTYSLVTLHGFLKIIPEEYITPNMFNGHPGLITKYPELKGFNPQQKAFDLQLPSSGSVIHKVIKEVDSGEIISYNEVSLEGLSLDEVYESLKQSSLELWIKFIKEMEKL